MTSGAGVQRRRLAVGVAGLLTLVSVVACASEAGAPGVGEPGVGSSASSPAPTPERSSTPTDKPTPTKKPTLTPSKEPTMSEREATRALLSAVRDADVDGVRSAVAAGADLETRDRRERTPLIIATKANAAEVAIALLEAGADPNAKDDISDSAFLYAGAEGYNDILRATLEHDADVKSTNRFNGTALIPASEHGYVETVRILTDAGVPLDHVNDLGWTAMLEAIVLGNGSEDHVDVVRQLVEAGADVSIADRDGQTPRELAQARGFDAIVAVIDAA